LRVEIVQEDPPFTGRDLNGTGKRPDQQQMSESFKDRGKDLSFFYNDCDRELREEKRGNAITSSGRKTTSYTKGGGEKEGGSGLTSTGCRVSLRGGRGVGGSTGIGLFAVRAAKGGSLKIS